MTWASIVNCMYLGRKANRLVADTLKASWSLLKKSVACRLSSPTLSGSNDCGQE
jgi:hypothetical protein